MPLSLGSHPRYLEELRIGGGYDSNPDGGADFDKSGNIAANGSLELDGNATIGGDIVIDGNTSTAGDATIDGDLTLNGVNTNWSVYLPASLGMPDPALPCGPVTPANWRNYQVATPSLPFDPNSPEAAYFQFHLPKNYDGRPLKFTIEWSATAGTAGVVRWGVLPISFLNGSNLFDTGSTDYANDAFLGTKLLHVISVTTTPTHPSDDSLNTVRVIRLSNDASDTFDSDVLLLGIRVSY